MRSSVLTKEKKVDLRQQHWQVDKELQNHGNPSPTPHPRLRSHHRRMAITCASSRTILCGARDRRGGVHVQETLGLLRLPGFAWQCKRVWEARLKCLCLVVKPGSEQIYCMYRRGDCHLPSSYQASDPTLSPLGRPSRSTHPPPSPNTRPE